MSHSNVCHTKPNGRSGRRNGTRRRAARRAQRRMDGSSEWSLELSLVVIFLRGLALHDLWSMGPSPRAP
jgi:hypothetical protein